MSTLEPGQLFAKDFQVERRLSQGGMGAVYVARQLSTDKLRALKLMHPQLAPDARSRQRFVDEARIGGRIDSEHVVEVVAAGIDEASGAPWLAMELLDGEDLGELSLRRGALPVGEVRDVFLQAGHALGLAHDKGIVHRDLKPENLFLARARREGGASVVKVLDFGIALALPSGGAGVVTTTVGSPFWMAPEQAKPGATLTPSTDVWALGLIAFQLISGGSYWRTAKQSDASIGAVLTEILVEPLDLASKRAAELGLRLPPVGFDAWFTRCVSREASERFADARACLTALDALLAPLAARVPVASSRSVKETAASVGFDATLQRATPSFSAEEPKREAAPVAVPAPKVDAAPVAPAVAVVSPGAAPASPLSSRMRWVGAAVVVLFVALGASRLVVTPTTQQPTTQQPTTQQPTTQQPTTQQPTTQQPTTQQPTTQQPTAQPGAVPVADAGDAAAPPDAPVPAPVTKHVRPPATPLPPPMLFAERVAGQTCPRRHVTVAQARANVTLLCPLLAEWDIVRLAGGGSMDGRGYQCKVHEHDARELGFSLCQQ